MATLTRPRCTACGNLTRFDVVINRLTREYHHYTVGGDFAIEETELLEEYSKHYTCRWCGADGDQIEWEAIPVDPADAPTPANPD